MRSNAFAAGWSAASSPSPVPDPGGGSWRPSPLLPEPRENPHHACRCHAVDLSAPVAGRCGPIDINSADAKQIAKELKGLGIVRARSIVAYREKNGPFKSAQDLAKVKGIGKKMLQKNLDNIRVDSVKSVAESAAGPAHLAPVAGD